MANICFTTYKITGIDKNNAAYNDLKTYLDNNSSRLWLGDLAKHYNVDFASLGISARGNVCYYEEDNGVITLDVESAWSPNDRLFEEINKRVDNQLSISYRAEEPGWNIFWIHDEGGFFSERYIVDAIDCEDVLGDIESCYCENINGVIDLWCKAIGYERGEEDNDKMIDIINNWEYDNDDVFFQIRKFVIE